MGQRSLGVNLTETWNVCYCVKLFLKLDMWSKSKKTTKKCLSHGNSILFLKLAEQLMHFHFQLRHTNINWTLRKCHRSARFVLTSSKAKFCPKSAGSLIIKSRFCILLLCIKSQLQRGLAYICHHRFAWRNDVAAFNVACFFGDALMPNWGTFWGRKWAVSHFLAEATLVNRSSRCGTSYSHFVE